MDEHEQIEFPGDPEKHLPEGWWRFRPYLCYGAQSRIEALATAGMSPQQVMDGAGSAVPVDMVAADAIMVLHSTIEWSFGPVTQDVLDGIPGAYVKQALERMDALYATPLAEVVSVPPVKSNDSRKQPAGRSVG